MADKVTLKNGDDQAYRVQMEQEANLIKRFFAKLAELKKSIVIKYYPSGQFSGNAGDHHLPANVPEKVYANSAWVGFTFRGIFYRTETIKCRKAFMAWLAELLDDTKECLWQIGTFEPPKGVRFYSPQIAAQ